MKVHPGDAIIGVMMIGFAVLGVFLAMHALDLEMSVFGIALAAFAVLFLIDQFRRIRGTTPRQATMERQHG